MTPGQSPPLGWIEPKDRTNEQHDAHAAAMTAMPKFAMPAPPALAKGDKIMLTDFWKQPAVIQDIGFEYSGFGQNTGSCVGVSLGNIIATLSFVQRMIATDPTKAFVPWWPFNYGRTRYNEGDRGQGEGAVDSVAGQQLVKEGVFDIAQPGLPAFTKTGPDGLWLTAAQEMTWSDGARIDQKWLTLARQHPLGTLAPIYDVDAIEAAITNGYPVLDGCSKYVGNGSIRGSGDTAYVRGRYDGSGGHSTGFLGVWIHPNDGRLFLYSNQWPTSVYPKDPAGGGRCTVWIPESEVVTAFRNYGMGNGECMACSHLSWFPSQPAVIATDWMTL